MYKLKYMAKLLIVIGFILSSTADAGLELPSGISMNVSVKPLVGALYLNTNFFEDLKIYNYTYTFELLGADKERRPKRMWLQFQNESIGEWTQGVEIDNPKQDSIVVKEVNLSKELGEYLGDVKYRVVSGLNDTSDSILYESTGPRIVVNFKNESSTKLGEDLYNYSVFVRSSKSPLDVYIYYSNQRNNIIWDRYSEIQTYRNKDWALVSWGDAPWFRRLEFQATIK